MNSIFNINSLRRYVLLFFVSAVFFSFGASAQNVLFEEDFEDGINGDPHPIWSWNIEGGAREGMMVGKGDIYEVIEGEEFITHRKSLRMDFGGRNNFCNICGGFSTKISSIADGKACVSAEPNEYESYVYNRTNSFSRWEVVEARDDRVCFSSESPMEGGIHGADPDLSVDDNVLIPYVCGVSGVIGRDVSRKSDCNKAVNYLDIVDRDQLDYGETVSRRFYIYIDPEAELPSSTFKLAYTRFWHKEGRAYNSKLKISTQRDNSLQLNMPNREPGNTRGSFYVPVGKWVYFEELFTRESSENADDAVYKLWASPIDEYSPEPLKHVEGFKLGQIFDMSIGGNWQHHNDVKGYVYFDNIKIAKEHIGPVNRPVVGN